MSIFGRDESPNPQPTTQPAAPKPNQRKGVKQLTQISSGTRIEGQISGPTEVQIDGTVDGQVHVGSVVHVAANGQVNGEIRAKSVFVAGTVVGNIVGEDKVDIQTNGKLQGDVKSPRVSIADGAYFKGRVEMTGQAEAEPAQPAAKPAQPAAKPAQPAAEPAQPAAKPAPAPKPAQGQATTPAGQSKLDSVPMGDGAK